MTLSLDLQHSFPGFSLDLRFEAPAGVTALFGRSGSGKTTIVNAVAGLLRPDRGRIALGDHVLFDAERRIFLPPHRRRIGYVFQEGRLFPHMSVRRNLLYGRRFAAPHRSGAEVSLEAVVDLLGIGALLERRPIALSGGEKARVAIGRALLARPELLLMDEPLAALDAPRKEEILPYLERLRDELRIPILYVSHSVAEVARLATTVAMMQEGRLLRAGPTAEVLADPGAAPALGLREAGALIEAELIAQEADGISVFRCSGGMLYLPRVEAALGSQMRIRIHAQDVLLARSRPEGLSALNILEGQITAIRWGEGPGALVQLRAGQDLILSRITRRSAEALGLAEGEICYAILKSVAVGRSDLGYG